jgi:hypothetical protein
MRYGFVPKRVDQIGERQPILKPLAQAPVHQDLRVITMSSPCSVAS